MMSKINSQGEMESREYAPAGPVRSKAPATPAALAEMREAMRPPENKLVREEYLASAPKVNGVLHSGLEEAAASMAKQLDLVPPEAFQPPTGAVPYGKGSVFNPEQKAPPLESLPEAEETGELPLPEELDALETFEELVDQVVEQAGGKLSLENVQGLIVQQCDSLKELLLDKNRKYGNSALEPIRIFSKASPVEQLCVRIDDKLKRIQNMGIDETPDEDTLEDTAGYIQLLLVARRLGLR